MQRQQLLEATSLYHHASKGIILIERCPCGEPLPVKACTCLYSGSAAPSSWLGRWVYCLHGLKPPYMASYNKSRNCSIGPFDLSVSSKASSKILLCIVTRSPPRQHTCKPVTVTTSLNTRKTNQYHNSTYNSRADDHHASHFCYAHLTPGQNPGSAAFGNYKQVQLSPSNTTISLGSTNAKRLRHHTPHQQWRRPWQQQPCCCCSLQIKLQVRDNDFMEPELHFW